MRCLFAIGVLLLAGCHSGGTKDVVVVAPPPVPPPFCTRTLGVAQCFTDPASLPDHPAGLGDGQLALTPAQEKDRAAAARWAF
jgi:hypothetical protein